jgi:hypothetical protein
MKKIILSAVALMAFGFASAQDLKSKKGENYLPETGDWAIGFNANNLFDYAGNSFNGSTTNTIGSVANNGWNGTFVGKKFTSEAKADRYLVDFGVNVGTATAAAPAGSTEETKVSTTGFNLAVGLGKEWRKGKTRLQGFYGADLVLGIESNSTKTEFTDSADATANLTTEVKSGLGLNVGARGFLGAEYFIFPKMAIGAQYTYNVGITVAGAETTTVSTTAGSTESKGGSSFGLNIGNVGVASMNLTLHF